MSAPTPSTPVLIARDAELARLDEAVAVASAGNGRCVLIEGPPGIGKTALLERASVRARALSLRVLAARGTPVEQAFGFGVARQLLERAAADHPAGGAAALALPALGLEPARGPLADGLSASFHGIYWLVAELAAHGPLALLVDDAHWADDPSLGALAHLARRLADLPVLLVCAAWPPREVELGGALEDLRAESAVIVRPEPLSDASVALMLQAHGGRPPGAELAAAVHRASGGSPLLVEQLAVALADEQASSRSDAALAVRVDELGPEPVAALVVRRVAALGPDALALARAVAVLQRPAAPALAAALAALPLPAALRAADALAEAHVLAHGAPLRYVHPVVRRAIADQLAAGARATLHARAARLLDARGGPVEEVAAHLLLTEPAGEPWVAARLQAAARRGLAGGAVPEAVRLLRRAVDERPRDLELRAELARACLLVRDPEGRRLLEELWSVQAGADRARTAIDLSRALAAELRADDAVDILREALPAAGDAETRMAVQAELLIAGMFAARPQPLPAPLPRGETPAQRALLAAAATARLTLAEPVDEIARLVDVAWGGGALLADAGPDALPVVTALGAGVLADRFDVMDGRAAAAMEQASSRGSITGYVAALGLRSYNAYRRGDLTAALDGATEALAIEAANPATVFLPITLMFVLEAFIETGRLAEAHAFLARHDLDGDLPESYPFDILRERRGRLRVASGDLQGGLDDLQAAGRRLAFIRVPAGSGGAQTALALIACGRRDEARTVAAAEVELARRTRLPRSEGIALRALALAHDPVDEALLREAADACGRAGAMLEQARALHALGAAQRRRGARAQAREPLYAALDAATRCGATALAEQSATDLLASGARPRRPVRMGRDALTPSERRVADLAGAGRSNKEIAQALFITVRTVEMHLTAVYRKLGIRSRDQLPGRQP